MNRNTQSHFANLPGIEISRSKFDRSFTHKTTLSAGKLYPVYVDPDIVPGDTVTMRQAEIIRMMTPITPVMDECWIDFYWFFTPNRLVWSHFREFMGENTSAPWVQRNEYKIPQIEINNSTKGTTSNKLYRTVLPGSLLDYMGIPTQNDWEYGTGSSEKKIKISQLPTRAYCLIWNEFFRDENLQNPVYIDTSDSNANLINSNWATDEQVEELTAQTSHEYKGGLPPLPVCKTHDYFTSALPGSLKSANPVRVPINGEAPVKIRNNEYNSETSKWEQTDIGYSTWMGTQDTPDLEGATDYPIDSDTTYNTITGYGQMYADLMEATGASVVQLRQAFAIQKYLERDARSGTRYIENVLAHFGVRNPDYRLQRPEYLGGFRQTINMNQVVQSTPLVDGGTPLGTTGAYSLTSHSDNDVFSKSFTEHGILMCVCCIRNQNTYQQGINRAWLKKEKFDFYSPEFANLSEQFIKNIEIYAQGTSKDEEAFGYQEAWAEMRYMPDIVSSMMRSNYPQSLDIWHYADDYEALPKLGDKWIQSDKENIQRTLAVDDYDQFMLDVYFGAIYTRPMPLYSVPGLIDHH